MKGGESLSGDDEGVAKIGKKKSIVETGGE